MGIEERNLKAQFETEQKAMNAHQLGHGSCPACQRDTHLLMQDRDRLSATNAKLIAAMENVMPLAQTGFSAMTRRSQTRDQQALLRAARAAIEEANK